MDNRQAPPQHIYQQLILDDPVLRIIIRVTHQKTSLIVLLAFAVYGGAYLGLGWWISSSSSVNDIVPIFDRRELIPIIINFFLISPIVWIYYTQESARIVHMFQKLSESGIFSPIQPSGQPIHEFLQRQIIAFNTQKRYLYLLIALLITAIFLINYLIGDYSPQNTWRIEHRQWWHQVHPVYFIAVFLPLSFLNYYMSSWFFMRRIIAVTIINRALTTFKMTPHLSHPDQANGLSSVGRYVTRVAPLIAAYGLFVFDSFLYPTFWGKTINVTLDNIVIFAAYILLAPLVLYLPVQKLHQVMSKQRVERLEAVAKQICTLTAATERDITLPKQVILPLSQENKTITPPEFRELITTIDSLLHKYQLFEKEYRRWPFGKMEVGGYVFVTVVLPPILSFIQSIGQLISLYK